MVQNMFVGMVRNYCLILFPGSNYEKDILL